MQILNFLYISVSFIICIRGIFLYTNVLVFGDIEGGHGKYAPEIWFSLCCKMTKYFFVSSISLPCRIGEVSFQFYIGDKYI